MLAPSRIRPAHGTPYAAPSQPAGIMHTPPVHSLVGALHTRPHSPQSVAVSSGVSQPSLGVELQSSYPGSQVTITHPPPEHAEVACASTQGALQLPQCIGSLFVSISQPSTGIVLQSSKPGSHIPIPHAPPTQTGVAFGTTQTLPHVLQFDTEACVSTQAMSQHASDPGHVPAASQPITQARSTQRSPASQSLELRQSTQVWTGTSHTGVAGVSAQSSFVSQPSMHSCVETSQNRVSGVSAQSALVSHSWHVCVPGSQ